MTALARAKFRYVRSEKLMKLYRTIPCQNCGRSNGTVCGAHSNQAKHGHGRGIKASDEFCASLCSECHYELDQGMMMSREHKVELWERAHKRTKTMLGDAYLALI